MPTGRYERVVDSFCMMVNRRNSIVAIFKPPATAGDAPEDRVFARPPQPPLPAEQRRLEPAQTYSVIGMLTRSVILTMVWQFPAASRFNRLAKCAESRVAVTVASTALIKPFPLALFLTCLYAIRFFFERPVGDFGPSCFSVQHRPKVYVVIAFCFI